MHKSRIVILAALTLLVLWLLGPWPVANQNELPSQVAVEDQPTQTSGYLGHKRCADCHDDIHDAHVQSSHAATFAFTKHSTTAKALCGFVMNDETRGAYEYGCDADGLTVSIPERFGKRLFPLDFALGSGKHAVTFVTLLPDNGKTVGVEHRYSVFADGELRITPGQEHHTAGISMEAFGKVIRGAEMRRCIDCHITTGLWFHGQNRRKMTN